MTLNSPAEHEQASWRQLQCWAEGAAVTPPPPVGEYSIVTFLSAVEIQRGQQQPRLALVNLRQVCWIVKDKAFYGTERYVVEVEVMDFLTGRSQMKNVACEMNLKDDFIALL